MAPFSKVSVINLLTEEEFKKLVDPKKMTHPFGR
jgi:hypothetical protein